jgi:putative ABC transport system permease protein
MTRDDLTELASHPITAQLQLRLPDAVTGAQVQQLSTEILSMGDDLRVGGGAPERTYYEQLLDLMLLIVLTLLAIAVVIAVVGIGNTMALSVIERRRESGLLRSLGLTRGQLRGMLATEATLITAVAALCGLALGTVYAWAGLAAAGLEAKKLPLGLSLPWNQLGIVLLGALAAGLIASVLPARRAANLSPIEGLAND